MQEEPGSAAEIARVIAESLAFSGASAEDVAQAMKDILNTSLALGNTIEKKLPSNDA